MKKKMSVLLLLGIVSAVAAQQQAYIEHSRQLVAEFSAQLKTELQSGLQQGGVLAAITHCQAMSPALTASSSHKDGWQIGRTALKYRNPDNKPDDWEEEVLNWFEARKQEGEKPEQLEFSTIIEQNGGHVFRYMKAIPAQPVCLACHGEQLDEKLGQRIKELYPEDKATGFKAGDIRGAFTVTHKLD